MATVLNQNIMAENNTIFKTSFEENKVSTGSIKMQFKAGGKITKETAILGKKSVNLPSASHKASVLFEKVVINWKQGSIGFSFKLRTTAPRIICHLRAQLTDKPEKIGFTISKDKNSFIFAIGNKSNQRAYFNVYELLKKNVWHRAVFTWTVNKDRSAIIKCYVDGRIIGNRCAVIQGFLPENYTNANPAQISLGQYLSSNSKYGFDGYLDAFIVYNNSITINNKETIK